MNFSETNTLPTTVQTGSTSQAASVTTTTTSPQLDTAVSKLSEPDLKAWKTFESILQTKNDNDSRMDQDLKKLSPEMRKALFEKYNSLPAEDRSDRGLITFLIARDITTPDDLSFLKSVFEESPCLSLADCKTVGPDDPHFSSVNQTTLNYPQLNTLFQLEKTLEAHPEYLKDPEMREKFVATLRQAETFAVPVVQQKAQQIRARFQL